MALIFPAPLWLPLILLPPLLLLFMKKMKVVRQTLAAPVDLTQKVYALVASITFRVAYGLDYRRTTFDREGFHEVVHDTEAVVGSISADEYIPYLGWIVDWLTGHRARMERVFHEVDTFFQHVIDNHLQPGRKKDQDDMIDVLLTIEKEQTEVGASQFTRDNIKAILLVCRSTLPLSYIK
ncbi:P450 putative-RELATED [Salix purpurea]|uniref:P450 putative-RELATED n=1 Tax=Salix purpurea TaxID=77065 RepID=A0A9Q0TXM3_SALPP|nr:P450 putative-RELATED [Salix purpurea]